MRKTLLFLMLLSVKLTFGQVSDDFTDGNFSVNPSWTGQSSSFFINGSKQLQSSLSSVSQSVSLSTPNLLALNVKWEFLLQLNFDPSASNQAKIYLIADAADLNGPINGYFLQVGEAGSADSYDLYRQTGVSAVKIIDGLPKTRISAASLLARIRITRSDLGKWELYTDITGGNNFSLEGTAIDLNHAYTDWFGINCNYTATRSDGFIFDDFTVAALSPDLTKPALVSAKALDDHTIEAVFSERIELTSALMAANYAITNLSAPNSVTVTAAPNIFKLNYANALPSGDYKLVVKQVSDLSGNVIGDVNTAAFFYLKPYTLKKNDVMISEILVNPRTGGVDFIEIYNATNQTIDLSALQLANVDANGNPASIKNVSATALYMPAKTYWVLTTNQSLIKQQYEVKFPEQFAQMGMPAFNNDKGSVILMTANGILEQFNYNEKMHLPLLQNSDGVALERVSFAKDVNDSGNFQSAARSVGFATPTFRNSQEEDPLTTKNSVTIANQTFSPDGDGFEDQLQIDYRFVSNGNLATVNIFTDKGVLVRKLERNTSIATEGSFIWDGKNDAGQSSKVGIYIIKFDAFALNGKAQSFKKIGVLAAKLN
jgi:hypothetical protein